MSGASDFDQVLLRGTTLTGVLHLTWIASQQGDRLVQVYLNGELYDVSVSAAQREMWLICGGANDVSVTLQMVDANHAWTNVSEKTGIELAMLRDESLPVDARVVVNVDGQDIAEGLLWSAEDFRSGFGGLFAIGEFGRDAASAPGMGVGEFGVGGMGMDGVAWRWRPRPGKLGVGEHVLNLRVTNRNGNVVAEMPEPRAVWVKELPAPAAALSIDETFTLHIQP